MEAFPAKPFSIAGVSKKNSLGRLHGFDDVKQGNLFFSIADILDHHRPDAFLLENVENLKGHDKVTTRARQGHDKDTTRARRSKSSRIR